MNILQLISSKGYYGTENMLSQLGVSLGRLGCHSVAGVFENLHSPNLEVAESVRHHGTPVETIRCRGRLDWRAVRKIREYLTRENIEIVHTHGYKANLYGYAAARPLGIPLVATCHNWPGRTFALRIYYWLDHIVLRRFDRVAVVSERVGQSLRHAGVAPERIFLIENGIDVSLFANAAASCKEESTELRIGVVGRLAPEKGVEFFLRAAPGILQKHPLTKFFLVGDGPQRNKLQALVRDLHIDKDVIFTGTRQDMPNVYASIDIFVLPSLNEGLPLALLEAMAAGKSVVATRVGAIPSVIATNRTGLLVEPRDIVALQDSILRLIEDSDLRRRLGKAAQEAVALRYSSESMASNYFNLYSELVRNRADA